jgi:hypothetical protein
MRTSIAATFIALSAFFTGCAVAPEAETDLAGEGETASTEDALKISDQLVGAFEAGSTRARFVRFVFQADGTYFADRRVECIKAPCPPVRESGTYRADRPFWSTTGTLTLKSGGSTARYPLAIVSRGRTFDLQAFGVTARYKSVGTYCAADADCDGQSYVRPMCLGHAVCDTTTKKCGWRCGEKPVCDETLSYISRDPKTCMLVKFGCAEGFEHFSNECGCGCKPAPKPACDYNDPKKWWVSHDINECAVMYVKCAKDRQYYSNECGCGCELVDKPVEKACVPGGCSGQICEEEGTGTATTCEWRPEYACFQKVGKCGRDAAGKCAWLNTDEIKACASKPVDEKPVEKACVRGGCSGQVCEEEGTGTITTCEWRAEYACYKSVGKCGRDAATGKCGWLNGAEIKACAANAKL